MVFKVLNEKIYIFVFCDERDSPRSSRTHASDAKHIVFRKGRWSQKFSTREMQKTCFLYLPNLDGFKLSIHDFKALAMAVTISYFDLKSMDIWTSYAAKIGARHFSGCLGRN